MDADQKKLTKKERRELKRQQRLEEEGKKLKQESAKKYIGWGIGIAVLIGLGFFLKVAFTPPPGTIPEIQSVNPTDRVKGATESAVLLIEYSDFQCPACRQYYPVVKQLVEEKGDQFTFAYRHFPLTQHENADEAARAAEAAGRQEKFWEMHDLLFERQDAWAETGNPDETFQAYAEELGLSMDQYTADYTAQELKDKISNDYNSGVKAGVNATPTFFLNGEKIRPGSLDEFSLLIDQANETN
ncbi:thioredoxin domain-containing protein [Candidatus Roizmanbacteria bacterium]|nr:thioredoxin domain-containing protein [Candidatus Roizmanbacteria bacterium]